MNFLLEVNPNETMGFFDALSFGGQTALIGMATVFAVLIIIWGALIIFKLFLYDIPNKKSAKVLVDTESVIPQPTATVTDDAEIIAVIAAAIATAEAESTGAKFKVVSFRRK